jgi:hypothetical protein
MMALNGETFANDPTIAVNPLALKFAVLPGDVNGHGRVSFQVVMLVRNPMQGNGDPSPIGWAYVAGDGMVEINDYNAARTRVGSRLQTSGDRREWLGAWVCGLSCVPCFFRARQGRSRAKLIAWLTPQAREDRIRLRWVRTIIPATRRDRRGHGVQYACPDVDHCPHPGRAALGSGVDLANDVAAPVVCPHRGGPVSVYTAQDPTDHLQEDLLSGRRHVTLFRHPQARCQSCRRWVQKAAWCEILVGCRNANHPLRNCHTAKNQVFVTDGRSFDVRPPLGVALSTRLE